jgi:transposase InsO family protein
MDAETKLARRRLSVLELAEALGNVSEACRRSGMDRTSFYAWQKRFEEQGLEGLRDLPPVVKSHPMETVAEVVEQVLNTSYPFPTWGCVKVSDYLKLKGVSISSPTVQKILIRHGMASRYERLLKLEARHFDEGLALSQEQVLLIEKNNPVFAERHVESSKPGELLCQDTKLIGNISGLGKGYLHAVVDAYGSFAFGFLHTSKVPEAAVALLHNTVIPQLEAWNIPIGAILTDNGREYCGTEAHPYQLYLRLNDIEHRTTKVKSPQTNGFVERFSQTVKEEFLPISFRKKLYTRIDQLQDDLDLWLHHYSFERPHQGYRNLGGRPFDTVKLFIPDRKQAARREG